MSDTEEAPNTSQSQASAPATPLVPQFIQSNIPLPSKLNLKGNLTRNWKRFKRLWTNYEIAPGLNSQSSELTTATLLTCIGSDALEIFYGLPFENEAEKTSIVCSWKHMGETNEIYERYLFNKRNQETALSNSRADEEKDKIVDEFFRRYEAHVVQDPDNHALEYVNCYMLIQKL